MACLRCAGLEEGATPTPQLGKQPTVGELIDELPLGRFHYFHVGRQMLQNACVAVTLEMVPYIVPGIMDEFGVANGLDAYAAVFTGGSILGAGLVSLQDSLGRIPVVQIAACVAMVVSFLSAAMPNFASILALRALLGVAFSFQQYGFGGWFAEFLPRVNRGPLYAALTAGA